MADPPTVSAPVPSTIVRSAGRTRADFGRPLKRVSMCTDESVSWASGRVPNWWLRWVQRRARTRRRRGIPAAGGRTGTSTCPSWCGSWPASSAARPSAAPSNPITSRPRRRRPSRSRRTRSTPRRATRRRRRSDGDVNRRRSRVVDDVDPRRRTLRLTDPTPSVLSASDDATGNLKQTVRDFQTGRRARPR